MVTQMAISGKNHNCSAKTGRANPGEDRRRISMDVETAIQAFASADHNPPRDAMQWALDHWDEVAPGLLNLLERFANGADRSNDAASTVFFILHLAGYCGMTALLWK